MNGHGPSINIVREWQTQKRSFEGNSADAELWIKKHLADGWALMTDYTLAGSCKTYVEVQKVKRL